LNFSNVNILLASRNVKVSRLATLVALSFIQGLVQGILILFYGCPAVANGQGDMEVRGDGEVDVEPCQGCGC
jgi:hypothetical protein